MIKKILFLLCVMTLFLSGCSKQVKEYDMDQFSEKCQKTWTELAEATKYWTEEDLQDNSKGYELVSRLAKENGLKPNTRIRVRGIIRKKLDGMIMLGTKNDEKEDNGYPILLYYIDAIDEKNIDVNEGDIVVIEGIILNKKMKNSFISEWEIVSP